MKHFQVDIYYVRRWERETKLDIHAGKPIARITAKQVAQVVRNIKGGKFPGHDSLSIIKHIYILNIY